MLLKMQPGTCGNGQATEEALWGLGPSCDPHWGEAAWPQHTCKAQTGEGPVTTGVHTVELQTRPGEALKPVNSHLALSRLSLARSRLDDSIPELPLQHLPESLWDGKNGKM